MLNEDYISKKGNKFIVHRIFDGNDYIFGEFSTLDEAISEREELSKNGWPISMDLLKKNEPDEPYLNLSFKVGKSYKHKFMVLTRDETLDLIPELPYEKECDIVLDDINATIRLNVLLRLIITKGNEKLIEYLKELSEDEPNQRKNVKLLLNKNFRLIDVFDSDELNRVFNESEEYNEIWDSINELNSQIEKIKDNQCKWADDNLIIINDLMGILKELEDINLTCDECNLIENGILRFKVLNYIAQINLLKDQIALLNNQFKIYME